MGMEVNVRRSRPKNGWAEATVEDPAAFMATAFKIAELARDATNVEMTAEEYSAFSNQMLLAAVELAHAVYGDFYTPKGNT